MLNERNNLLNPHPFYIFLTGEAGVATYQISHWIHEREPQISQAEFHWRTSTVLSRLGEGYQTREDIEDIKVMEYTGMSI